MSRKLEKRAYAMQQIFEKRITQIEAAVKLNITLRQCKRIFKSWKKDGIEGLEHKLKGKSSKKRISQDLINRAIYLIKTKYNEAPNRTILQEKLHEEGISIKRESLRLLLNKFDLFKSKKRKARKTYLRRPRKAHFGELVLIDGSEHLWFDNIYSRLVCLIDDATSIINGLFGPSEDLETVSIATRLWIDKYGVPHSLYSDRGSVFRVNKYNKYRHGDRPKTQYERMLKELGSSIIHARTPQAKGRIERIFGTLQDRLWYELRLRNEIKTIQQANKFLQEEFLPEFNKKNILKLSKIKDFHTPIDTNKLDNILILKHIRSLNNDFTIQYKNKIFQLKPNKRLNLMPHKNVIVCETFSGIISIYYQDNKLDFQEIYTRPKIKKPDKQFKIPKYSKPAPNHPWRHSMTYMTPTRK